MSTDYELQSAEQIEATAIDEKLYAHYLDLLSEWVPVGDMHGLKNPTPPELRERES